MEDRLAQETDQVKRKLTVLACALFLILSAIPNNGPVPTEESASGRSMLPAEFVGKNVLFDESHTANGSSLWAPGNASLFSWMLGENGYNSSTNFNSSLDSGILDDFDVLVIFFPRVNLTEAEVTAVYSFVEGGGGLLLIGTDSDSYWGFNSQYLNPLANQFGVTFNYDNVVESITSFVTHNITAGVSSFTTDGDDLDGCTLEVVAPATAVITGTAGDFVAVSEEGAGRVVFVGTPAPFYMYRFLGGSHTSSHFQFALNVIDWATKNPQRTASVPVMAEITLGPGPELTQGELEEYKVFVGLYHDHTTHSDGQNPAIDMLQAGLYAGYDFMILTDHSHLTPSAVDGIYGALEAKQITDTYGLDIVQIIGAELSSVHHTTGFPLTENIYTASQQEAVDEIHAQGGIATLCHPTLDAGYATTHEAFEDLGYDAIEIDNGGWFFGGGEDGFLYNFLGASDGHRKEFVGQMSNAIFVKNPTGPNGTISATDIIDAVLNKRVVVIDKPMNMLLGQEVWMNRLKNLYADAETNLIAAQSLIDGLKLDGQAVGLSEMYLDAAARSLSTWSVPRALRLIANATSSAAIGIDLTVSVPENVDPLQEFSLSITMVNENEYPVSVNSSMYMASGMHDVQINQLIESAAQGSGTAVRQATADYYGFIDPRVNILGFNTTEYLMPVIIRGQGLIDNVTYSLDEKTEGYEIDIVFWIGRQGGSILESVTIVYNDGSGQETVEMYKGFTTYTYSLGLFDPGTTVTFHLEVEAEEGSTYTLQEHVVVIPGGITTTTITTTTTTTTPTTSTSPTDYTPLLLTVGGLSVAVIVIIVVLRTRKPSS